MAGYFIDLILDSRSSVSVIAKHFLKAIGRKIDELSTKPITNVHSNKKKGLGITKAISVYINSISIKTDIKVFKAKKYTIIVGNKWLKKAKVLFDYKLLLKQNQKNEQSDESDDEENNEEENQEKQEKTAELAYTILIVNDCSFKII
ncbi:hypothetical protein G9A89_017732 [Geosiphon pyriformis]|nr:hypothetical protein G9A89_017732 [Geosiphon pyriformis]